MRSARGEFTEVIFRGWEVRVLGEVTPVRERGWRCGKGGGGLGGQG